MGEDVLRHLGCQKGLTDPNEGKQPLVDVVPVHPVIVHAVVGRRAGVHLSDTKAHKLQRVWVGGGARQRLHRMGRRGWPPQALVNRRHQLESGCHEALRLLFTLRCGSEGHKVDHTERVRPQIAALAIGTGTRLPSGHGPRERVCLQRPVHGLHQTQSLGNETPVNLESHATGLREGVRWGVRVGSVGGGCGVCVGGGCGETATSGMEAGVVKSSVSPVLFFWFFFDGK
mmetsp:Transcript_45784/g.115258  ORF Transcript_45784/g.115258 Transcript_45784/m.115258 type:complete len:229 (+) Transcript_45784:875-1561(+)